MSVGFVSGGYDRRRIGIVSLGSIVGDSLGLNEVGDLLGIVVVCNDVGLGDGRTLIVSIEKLISLSSMGINISIVLTGGEEERHHQRPLREPAPIAQCKN